MYVYSGCWLVGVYVFIEFRWEEAQVYIVYSAAAGSELNLAIPLAGSELNQCCCWFRIEPGQYLFVQLDLSVLSICLFA